MDQDFSKGVSTRVTEEMFIVLKELAQEQQRPISNMVRVLLTEALEFRKMGVSTSDMRTFVESVKGR
jgi:hypothetical protein